MEKFIALLLLNICRSMLKLKQLLPLPIILSLSRSMATTPKMPNVLRTIELPDYSKTWPFSSDDLRRQDESSDSDFYASPRFVAHIDEECITALTNVYSHIFEKDDDVLDLCSSWISHFPSSPPLSNVVGVGMNEQELARNLRLSSHVVQDLNLNSLLPFEDHSFDKVVNAVSVDYLAKPQEVFQEIFRVLKPGGIVAMSWSNRMFPTKVVNIWLRSSEEERVKIVQSYFLTCGMRYENVVGYQIFTKGVDPLYVVIANKPLSEDKSSL